MVEEDEEWVAGVGTRVRAAVGVPWGTEDQMAMVAGAMATGAMAEVVRAAAEVQVHKQELAAVSSCAALHHANQRIAIQISHPHAAFAH